MRQSTSLPVIQKSAGTPWNGINGNWDATSKPKTLIILHTMVGYLTGTDATFANPVSTRSANYGIGLNGEIHQYVREDQTAYHAGTYSVNLVSIGIEHEDNTNSADSVRTPEQYQKSAELVADICKAWGIPINREHIKKHNEIKATSCPGGLDVDKIVSMAQALVTEPKPEIAMDDPIKGISQDEYRGVEVLRSFFAQVKTFGNIEGLVRSLTDTYVRYVNLTQPDSSGNPPVVISHDHFVDINIKAQNFDKIAAYFGYTEINEVDPALGDKIVDTIKMLSKPEPKPPVSTTLSTSALENVIATTGSTADAPLKADELKVSLTGKANLIGDILGKLSAAYASLFLSKEVKL